MARCMLEQHGYRYEGELKMETLSPAELHIIRSMLLKKYGPRSRFLDQLSVAGVENRRTTGVGVFVDLIIPGNVAYVDQINTEISEDYQTVFDAPCDLVGFTLFIRNGYLSFLEGNTFGDVRWPAAAMDEWLIFDEADVSRYQHRGFPGHREKFSPRELLSAEGGRKTIFSLHV